MAPRGQQGQKKAGAEGAAAHTEPSPPPESRAGASMGLQHPGNRALCQGKGTAQQPGEVISSWRMGWDTDKEEIAECVRMVLFGLPALSSLLTNPGWKEISSQAQGARLKHSIHTSHLSDPWVWQAGAHLSSKYREGL